LQKVLLIDDNRIDLLINEKLVQRYFPEAEVTKKSLAKEALDYLHHTSTYPDLILLDIKMPEMDGFEFLDRLADYPFAQSLVIFMLSSSIDPSDLSRADENDLVAGYLQKPISIAGIERVKAFFSARK
jgi:CheY-like chemotaxis protein